MYITPTDTNNINKRHRKAKFPEILVRVTRRKTPYSQVLYFREVFPTIFHLQSLLGDDKRMIAVCKILGKGQIKSGSLHAIGLLGNRQTKRTTKGKVEVERGCSHHFFQ